MPERENWTSSSKGPGKLFSSTLCLIVGLIGLSSNCRTPSMLLWPVFLCFCQHHVALTVSSHHLSAWHFHWTTVTPHFQKNLQFPVLLIPTGLKSSWFYQISENLLLKAWKTASLIWQWWKQTWTLFSSQEELQAIFGKRVLEKQVTHF